jgi:hypothetical protein
MTKSGVAAEQKLFFNGETDGSMNETWTETLSVVVEREVAFSPERSGARSRNHT